MKKEVYNVPDYKKQTINVNRRKFLGVFATTGAALTLSGLPQTSHAGNKGLYPVSKDQTEEPVFMSATKLAGMIRDKKISSEELVEAYIDRIERVNYRLNAVVMQCYDRARQEAKAMDKALGNGDLKGPLHGVPMTLKDTFEAEGVISTGASMGRMNYVGKKDATVLARMRQNGAILLGKTNTPEFTLAGGGMRGIEGTGNIIYGVSKNPYDLSRETSGSSGGAGSIVAAGGSAFDIGTDWGGSVRNPSNVNGIAGIKPTSVRCPRTGHIVDYGGIYDLWQQPGPMARKVEDLILLTELMSGPDFKDAAVTPMPWPDPAKVDVSKLKVVYYPTNKVAETQEEIQDTVRQAAQWMEEAGAEVTEEMPKDLFVELASIRDELIGGDGWAFLKRLGDKLGTKTLSESIRYRLNNSSTISTSRYYQLLEMQDANRSKMLQWFSQYDLIVCPTAKSVAEPIDEGLEGSSTERTGEDYRDPYNTTGWPSTVVRCGGTASGLPIGIQCVAHPWREDISLAAAQYLESRSGGWKRPSI